MPNQHITAILFQPSRAWYSEQETASVSHLSIGTIRYLRTVGLIMGEDFNGELHYSEEEVQRMRRIRRLQHDLGINLAGVEVILHLLKRLEALQQELEQKHPPSQ